LYIYIEKILCLDVDLHVLGNNGLICYFFLKMSSFQDDVKKILDSLDKDEEYVPDNDDTLDAIFNLEDKVNDLEEDIINIQSIQKKNQKDTNTKIKKLADLITKHLDTIQKDCPPAKKSKVNLP